MGIVSSSLDIQGTPTDPLVCLLSSGCLAAVDWAPEREGTGAEAWGDMGAAQSASGESAPERPPGSRVLWSTADGAVPEPVAVLRHPSIKGLFLVLAAGSWTLYRVGSPRALLVSPPSLSAYTCGAWSPIRASVFFLGRQDGVMEAWDVIETVAGPATQPVPVATSPLTSMLFRATSAAAAAAMGGSAAGSGSGSPQALALGAGAGAGTPPPPLRPPPSTTSSWLWGTQRAACTLLKSPLACARRAWARQTSSLPCWTGKRGGWTSPWVA